MRKEEELKKESSLEIMFARVVRSSQRPVARHILAPTIPKRTLCSEGGRLHSSDIAFKPNDDGWGHTKAYASGWDRIFGNNKDAAATTTSSDVTDTAAIALLEQRMEALEAARKCGALSEELFAQAEKALKA